MSLEARTALVDRLAFNDDASKQDLLNEDLTNTFLIEMLTDVANRCSHKLLITATRTDHGYDGYLGNYSHSAGWSVDLWHADWMSVGDAKIVDVVSAALASPYVWTVGYGGSAQKFCIGQHSRDPRVVVFMDDGQDHVHLQAGNGNGYGKR